jgi:ribonuclease Z
MKVTILGAGEPFPTPARFGSAYLLDVGNQTILIDCGPATTYKLAQVGRNPAEVSTLLFTHHHFDHNADYPCFALVRWDQDVDQTPLRVYGPRPTEAITHALFAAPDGAYVCDWNARVEHPLSQLIFASGRHYWRSAALRGATKPRKAPEIEAVNIDANFVWEEDGFSVRAADTVHVQPYLDSLAYRIDSEAGRVVFSGDSGPSESVLELARGADMLICMCPGVGSIGEIWATGPRLTDARTHGDDGATKDLLERTYAMAPPSLLTTDAGLLAAEAGVGMLVLTHLSTHLDTPEGREQGLREVQAVYDGEVIFAEELQTLEVSAGRQA